MEVDKVSYAVDYPEDIMVIENYESKNPKHCITNWFLAWRRLSIFTDGKMSIRPSWDLNKEKFAGIRDIESTQRDSHCT